MNGPPSRPSVVRKLLRRMERALATVGLLGLVYHLCFQASPIGSSSMAPALMGPETGGRDWVLVERLSYRLRAPRRFELVAFRTDEGIGVIKRVMGLPGETLAVRGAELHVDGAPIERPPSLRNLHYFAYGLLAPGRTAACGAGYFLLGDDSADSQDSRFDGPLPPSRIRGRPLAIVWPPCRIGLLNP